MSRFFGGGSSSDSESSSSEEEVQVVQKAITAGTKAYPLSDDEEEQKRVVRSEKDKRFDEMNEAIKQLRNHKKIKDMANVLNDFELLIKAYEKAKKVIDKEGMPRFYVRCLVELEDFVNDAWEDREGRKTMSKNNSKGLTTLRQKLKKYNRDFESDIASYRESPDVGGPVGSDDGGAEGSDNEFVKDEAEEGSDDESASDDEFIVPTGAFKQAPTGAKAVKAAKDEDDDESDDSMDWGSSSDDDTESDDGINAENPALYFLKRDTDDVDVGKKIKKDRQDRESKKKDRREDSNDEEEEWKEVKGGAGAVQERPKMFAKDQEINHDLVFKKLMEVISARGKKSTDRTGQIDMLKELRTVSNANKLGPAIEAKILFHTIAAVFDYNPNIAACMSAEIWTDYCLAYIKQLIDILLTNPNIHVSENVPEDSESYTTEPYRLRGCVFTMVERMDEEFTKMLQGCDAHSTEYVDRLRDERVVCDIIDQLETYAVLRQSTNEETCRVYVLKIRHIYYKFDAKLAEAPTGTIQPPESSIENMRRLCKFIYAKDNTDRIRTQAILCHIYFLALHDRWFEARDLMLMSHLQDTIQHSDVPTQILYNRTMVQLGLCAFRQGMIKDAHNCLVDIQSSGRAKELLAQGLLLQRQHERTPEQEKIEKRRQMPYHMHINLELLECVYLVSAMLMEIPYMAAHELDARRRLISKNFHHVLRISERQPLVGPPESMREHVVQASKAMKRGEWKACRDFLINEKMSTKVWGLFHKSEAVRAMIEQKIQEESLRTFLFTYSSVYDSLSMVTLAEMFGLDRKAIHSVVSKMIINEELMASLDEPTQTVVMHRTEPSRLQSLALQLSEKVTALVDSNERLMEMKGPYFFAGGRQGGDRQGGYHQRDHQGDRGERGGYDRGERGGYDRGERGGYDRGERGGYDRGERGGYDRGERGHHQDRDRGGYDRGHHQDRDRGGYYQRDYQDRGQQGGWGRRQNRSTRGY